MCAVLAAVVELYLTGHGLGSIGAPLIEMPAAGVHLSIGDTVLLITAAGAAVATFLPDGPGRMSQVKLARKLVRFASSGA